MMDGFIEAADDLKLLLLAGAVYFIVLIFYNVAVLRKKGTEKQRRTWRRSSPKA